jgi:hypothetical protein
MNEIETPDGGQSGPPRFSSRPYMLAAVALVAVILVAAFFLITKGIPALKSKGEPTAAAQIELTATPVPTFTPGPTRLPTNPPPAATSPVVAAPVMTDTEVPSFEFDSAGARPGADWTGFFGQVLDEAGQPLPGVPVIVWYRDGTPASDVVLTDNNGAYEIHLADAPLAGNWSIQVVSDEGSPASKLFSFDTDVDTQAGVQQIQVIWRRLP